MTDYDVLWVWRDGAWQESAPWMTPPPTKRERRARVDDLYERLREQGHRVLRGLRSIGPPGE